MNDFNDIRSKWVQRNIPDIPKDGYKEIIKSSAYIKRKQLTGQLILMLTVIILGYFFFYISAFKNTRLTVGILLMIGTLLFRIGILGDFALWLGSSGAQDPLFVDHLRLFRFPF